MKCEYGCGREAKYSPRKGMKKWCCEENYQNCPGNCSVNTKEYITSFLEKRGYKWTSGYYKSSLSNLILECPNGHIYETNFNNFKYGGSCPKCSRLNYWSMESIKLFALKYNYKCISVEYNVNAKLEFICPKEHVFEMRWDTFYSGGRCPICKDINRSINFTGSGNPNWKGGITNDPYCEFWNDIDFKESIKIRDGYKCLNPYCFGKGKKLVIHHIDYDKKNCKKENLITVCNSCNSMANYNREWHNGWYKAILYRRYCYKY